MRPPPVIIPHSSSHSQSNPSTSSNSNLTLTLTVRHLPTDTWTTLTSVPTECRAIDLKRLALETFEGHRSRSDSKSPSRRRGKTSSSREDSQEEKENVISASKGTATKMSGDSLLSVAGSEKEKKSGGVRRFTNALRDRLSSRDLNAISTSLSPRPTPSPLRPTNASLSSANPLPSRHSLSTTPTPTSSSFAFSTNSAFDTPTRPRVRKSEDTHSRRSSMANFESLNLLTGRKKESLEPENEREVLVSVDEASPATVRRMERSKSLSEKNKTSAPGEAASAGIGEIDERELSRWILVNAVTGGAIADHAIVGSKLVENDILTLKPHALSYDPPLHLYHLSYQYLHAASVLPNSLSTCRTTFDFSPSKGHSRRKSSVGGRYKQEELVERRIEICVDDGVFAAAQGDTEMTPGTTMVLKVIKVNQVEAIYSLPPSSIQVVASSQAPASSLSLPPMPHSSSTTSFAALMLPSGPANITTPVPSTAVPSRNYIKALPLIQLGWEEGESLVLRASNKDEHERLMRILGETEPDDEEKDEKERQDRKDLIDLAFASRHQLLDLPFTPTVRSSPARSHRSASSQRPSFNRSLTSHSLVRPVLQPRSASASASIVPPVPLAPSRRDQITPKRASSILHVKKRESSLDLTTSDHTRSSTSTSTSTYSDSPSTPTSLKYPEATTTKTMITPATPYSHSYSPSSTNPSPASLISSSSSYFSLHSSPLVLPPFSYPRIPPSSSFTRAKSSLDLTSSLRSGSPLVLSSDPPDVGSSSGRRKMVRRATSNLDGRSQLK